MSSPVFYVDTRNNSQPAAYVAYSITNSTGSSINDLWVSAHGFSGGSVTLATNENGVSHVGPLANGATKTVYFYLAASTAPASAQTHSINVYNTKPSLGSAICSDSFSLSVSDTLDANANKVTGVTFSPNPPQIGGLLTINIEGDAGVVGGDGIFSLTPAVQAGWRADVFELESVSMTMTGGNNRTDNETLFITVADSADSHYVQTYQFRIKGTTASSSTIFPSNYINSGNPVKHTDTSNFASLPSISSPQNQVTISSLAVSPGGVPNCFASGTGGTGHVTMAVTKAGTVSTTLDDFVVTLPTSPGTISYVSSSATFDSSSIPEPTISGGGTVLTWNGYFTIPAGSSRTLEFDVTIPSTDGTYTITGVGISIRSLSTGRARRTVLRHQVMCALELSPRALLPVLRRRQQQRRLLALRLLPQPALPLSQPRTPLQRLGRLRPLRRVQLPLSQLRHSHRQLQALQLQRLL